MRKIDKTKKFIFVLLLGAFFVSFSSQAQADSWGRGRRDGDHHGRYYIHYPYPRYGGVYLGLTTGFVSLWIGG
jgi:hypothetical protein